MLNFYEFANRLDEVGGGALAGPLMAALKSAGSKIPEAKPEPKVATPEKANIGYVKPRPKPPKEVLPTPKYDPSKGLFANTSVPGAEEDEVITANPIGGPGRVPVSKQLDRAHQKLFGGINYGNTPSLQIDPNILKLKQAHPELAKAFLAINTAFRKNKPFTMGDITDKPSQEIINALKLLKADKQIDITDRRGNPATLSANDPDLVFEPTTDRYRGSKAELQGSSAKEKRAADQELVISPRLPSLSQKVSTTLKPGEGPKPQVEAPKAPLDVTTKIDSLQTSMLSILSHPMLTKDPKRQQSAKTMLDATWKRLTDLEKAEPKLVARAKQAIRQAVEKIKGQAKSGHVEVPGTPKAEWMDYYTMMESYWMG